MAARGKLLDSTDGVATEVKRRSHHRWREEEVVLQGAEGEAFSPLVSAGLRA